MLIQIAAGFCMLSSVFWGGWGGGGEQVMGSVSTFFSLVDLNCADDAHIKDLKSFGL